MRWSEIERVHPFHAFQSFMTYFANVSVALESSIGLQNGDDISSGRIARHPIELESMGDVTSEAESPRLFRRQNIEVNQSIYNRSTDNGYQI